MLKQELQAAFSRPDEGIYSALGRAFRRDRLRTAELQERVERAEAYLERYAPHVLRDYRRGA